VKRLNPGSSFSLGATSDGQGNAQELARLQGRITVVKANVDSMTTRFDASLAQLREDMARRDKDNIQ